MGQLEEMGVEVDDQRKNWKRPRRTLEQKMKDLKKPTKNAKSMDTKRNQKLKQNVKRKGRSKASSKKPESSQSTGEACAAACKTFSCLPNRKHVQPLFSLSLAQVSHRRHGGQQTSFSTCRKHYQVRYRTSSRNELLSPHLAFEVEAALILSGMQVSASCCAFLHALQYCRTEPQPLLPTEASTCHDSCK